MDILSKKQFKHICGMLKGHGTPVTKENIARYLKNNPNQFKKVSNRLKDRKIEFEMKQTAYLQNVLTHFVVFKWRVVIYKFGIKYRFFWGVEFLRKKKRKQSDR